MMLSIRNLRQKAAALVLAALFLCSPVAALGASADSTDIRAELWADANPNLPSEDTNSSDVIRWFAKVDKGTEMPYLGKTVGKQYYLLLPASADLTALTLWHSFSTDPVINGVAVKSGEVTTAITGEGDYPMTVGDKEYTLTVMKDQVLGSMYITTESGKLNSVHANKTTKEAGKIIVVDENGEVNYNGDLSYIKGRGNTTWNFKKKPYNIKLDKKAELLGMSASKKWCLLANAQDHSMLRNKIAYDLSDEIGLDFSPDSHHVNVYINGDYAGVYQLSEKVEAGKNNLVKINDIQDATEKVNDTDLESYNHVTGGTDAGGKTYFEIPNDPEDITGGYLLEFDTPDKYSEELSGFVTKRGHCYVVKNPEVASKAQIDYISSFAEDMEDAIYSRTGYNEKGKHYSEYLDTQSAALMYLVQEYSLNIDSGVTSCFFYKDSDSKGDGKIHAAPVWDFDVAFGNLDYLCDPEFVYARNHGRSNGVCRNIFVELCCHNDFNETVNRLYKEKFKPALDILNSSEQISSDYIKSIEQYRSELNKAAEMNFIRWNIKENTLVVGSGRSFDAQLDYVKNFTTKRAAMFDTLFKEKTPGDELVVYFHPDLETENQYVFCYNDEKEMEWPGVLMEKTDITNMDLYKIDLSKLGWKDDGKTYVIFNNGDKVISDYVPAENNSIVYEFRYYDENDNLYKYTGTTPYNEEYITETYSMKGDVDGDLVVTSSDALKILRFSVELDYPRSWEEYFGAMIDNDSSIGSADALYALRYSIGITKGIPDNPYGKLGEKQTHRNYNPKDIDFFY